MADRDANVLAQNMLAEKPERGRIGGHHLAAFHHQHGRFQPFENAAEAGIFEEVGIAGGARPWRRFPCALAVLQQDEEHQGKGADEHDRDDIRPRASDERR
jgi:hypothetical protein